MPEWLLRRLEKAMRKALLCKLNIHHEWHVEHADDGGPCSRCRRCGKDDDDRAGGRRGGEFSKWLGLSGWLGPTGGGGWVRQCLSSVTRFADAVQGFVE